MLDLSRFNIHGIGIDAQLRQLLGQPGIRHQRARRLLASTHGLYRSIHVVIALFLGAAAVAMVLYGRGWFSVIEVPKKAVGYTAVQRTGSAGR